MSAAKTDGPENQWWTQPGIDGTAMAEIADVIAEQAARATRAKGCVMWVLNRPQGLLHPLGAYGVSFGFLQRCALEIDGSVEVVASQPYVVSDLSEGARGIEAAAAQQEGLGAMASVPMLLKGAVTGVLRVFYAQPRQFTDDDIRLLLALAAMAATSVECSRVSQRARTLFEVARLVSSTISLPNSANLIAEYVAKSLHVKGCSIRYLDRQRRTLGLSGAYGLSAQYLTKGPIDADRSLAEAMAGRTVVVYDATNDPRIQYPEAAREEGVASMASLPMVLKGVVTGVLRVYTAHRYEFTAEDIEFLSALASISAAAIENAQLYDGIRSDFEELMDEIVYLRRQGRLKHEARS